MILRRFMSHVGTQNWFAVSLDVLVVITGIFLGMQVAEWNEHRKERGEESVYLERLKNDLTQDLELLAFGADLANQRIDQIRFLEAVLLSPERAIAEPDKVIMYLETASWESYLFVGPRTYEEMLSSGRTTLIQDSDLREKLGDYYRQILRWSLILATYEARHDFRRANAGLLSGDQLLSIEVSVDDIPKFSDLSKADALEIATQFANNKDAIKWLPQMLQYHVLVKQVIEMHENTVKGIIVDFEILLHDEK